MRQIREVSVTSDNSVSDTKDSEHDLTKTEKGTDRCGGDANYGHFESEASLHWVDKLHHDTLLSQRVAGRVQLQMGTGQRCLGRENSTVAQGTRPLRQQHQGCRFSTSDLRAGFLRRVSTTLAFRNAVASSAAVGIVFRPAHSVDRTRVADQVGRFRECPGPHVDPLHGSLSGDNAARKGSTYQPLTEGNSSCRILHH